MKTITVSVAGLLLAGSAALTQQAPKPAAKFGLNMKGQWASLLDETCKKAGAAKK